jgi:DNA-binding protein
MTQDGGHAGYTIIGDKPMKIYVQAAWTVLFRAGMDRVRIVAVGRERVSKAVSLAAILQDQYGCRVEGIKVQSLTGVNGGKKTRVELTVGKTPESTPEGAFVGYRPSKEEQRRRGD